MGSRSEQICRRCSRVKLEPDVLETSLNFCAMIEEWNTKTNVNGGLDIPKPIRIVKDNDTPINPSRRVRKAKESSKKIYGKGVVGIPRSLITIAEDNEWSPPRMPPVAEKLNNKIERCSVPFLKKLTSSDLDRGQNRLLFSSEYAINYLIPMLNPGESLGGERGIKVKAYDLEGKEYSMEFKAWHGKSHVLIAEWHQFMKEHGFEMGDWVVTWMFRHAKNQSLCFVITSKRDLENLANANRNREAGNQGHEARVDLQQNAAQQSEREEEENDQEQRKRAKSSDEAQ